MSITKRQEQILKLLQENRFLSVERLAQLTYTSPSSIRRDLTHLQNMCFIKRTHGGANILEDESPAPLNNRMTQNLIGKRRIAKKAARFLADGQCIMLDSSSTAGFLLPFIAKHKDITLFTNNMITAVNAINYGIVTHCIGGKSVNMSPVLSGEAAYEAVGGIYPDILFFSSHSIDKNGVITDPTAEENYIRSLMIKNASRSIFLCDSEKFGRRSRYKLISANDVDACVFDVEWKELRCDCEII